MRRGILLATVVFAISCGALRADFIYLDDGRKIEGTAVTEGDEVVVTTKMGVVKFPKEKVVKIDKVKGAAEVYKEKAAALKADDAEGHWQLAQWCKENKLIREMNMEMDRTITANPDHEQARAALNYVKIDGKWIKARAGMVWVDGKWTKPDEAIDKAKAFYKVEKYEDAYKIFDGALKALKKDQDVAEAQFGLGLCSERLGKWTDAKGAYDAILAMKGSLDLKGPAEARKAVIDGSTGGMYLVKETAAKDDIFSLDNDKKDKIKKLSGLQPLTNPDVFDIALREKCIVFIEKGKDFLKQAKDANTGSAESDKKTNDLIDKADEQFKLADRLVKDISRGYLIECVKMRIAVINNTYTIKAARIDGQLARLGSITDVKAQQALSLGLIKELDELMKQLDVIQKLAGQYPDELSQQVAMGKQIRTNVNQLKARLSAFAGK